MQGRWRPIAQEYTMPDTRLAEMLQPTGYKGREEDLKFEALIRTMFDEMDLKQAFILLAAIPIQKWLHFWVCAVELVSRTNWYARYRVMLVLVLKQFVHYQRLQVQDVINIVTATVFRGCKFRTWLDYPGFLANVASVVVGLMSVDVLEFPHLISIFKPFFRESHCQAGLWFWICVLRIIDNTDLYGHLYNHEMATMLYKALQQGRLHRRVYFVLSRNGTAGTTARVAFREICSTIEVMHSARYQRLATRLQRGEQLLALTVPMER